MEEFESNIEKKKHEFYNERNSLRRFLTGLTATTFGVLVALHPISFSSVACGILYMVSVILNAISVLSYIGSLFGRYYGLIEEGKNLAEEPFETTPYIKQDSKKDKYAWRFPLYTKIGTYAYICTILSSCIYIILEVCNM